MVGVILYVSTAHTRRPQPDPRSSGDRHSPIKHPKRAKGDGGCPATLCPSPRPLVTRHSRDRRPPHPCARAAFGPQMVRATYRVPQTQSRVPQSRVPGKGAVSAALPGMPSIEARDSLILRTNILLNLDFRGSQNRASLKGLRRDPVRPCWNRESPPPPCQRGPYSTRTMLNLMHRTLADATAAGQDEHVLSRDMHESHTWRPAARQAAGSDR